MRRTCNGSDANLLAADGVTPCSCGKTFDDVDHYTIHPHERFAPSKLGSTSELPVGFRVPVTPNVRKVGKEIGDSIAKQLPPGWGFGLFLFSSDEDRTMFWLSNGTRSDMVEALQEWMRVEGS